MTTTLMREASRELANELSLDSSADFFNVLARRGAIVPKEISGTIRFDLDGDDEIRHWFITIERGDLRVSREERPADCVVRTTPAYFEAMARGRRNALAALLRGDVIVRGNLMLFVLLDRLLPGPAGAHDPRDFARARGAR